MLILCVSVFKTVYYVINLRNSSIAFDCQLNGLRKQMKSMLSGEKSTLDKKIPYSKFHLRRYLLL